MARIRAQQASFLGNTGAAAAAGEPAAMDEEESGSSNGGVEDAPEVGIKHLGRVGCSLLSAD